MKYRPEIDGLRALAVVPVILFHANIPGFQGGFIGVDVFFVISGYLITSICHAEMQLGRFSFVRFYERRARRILPALFLVTLATIPFAWLWLLPVQFESYAKSLIGVSWFSSNFVFWKQSGYFDAATPLKPLLHTWSLAIEEQFYLIFPPLLLWAERNRKAIVPALLMVTIASLVLAQVMSARHPEAAFYLLHTRAWELAIGAVAAICQPRIDVRLDARPMVRPAVSVIGLALIVLSVVFLKGTLPYPSLYTLAPTIGAAMFISAATSGDPGGRLLSSRPFVLVGQMSYSLYLWHQPIFALFREEGYSEPKPLEVAFLLALTVVLATLSWQFVEKPFRRVRERPKPIFLLAATGILGFTAVGLVGIQTHGFANRLPQNVEWETLGQKIKKIGRVCEAASTDGYPGVKSCFFGDLSAKKTIALYGDSHSDAVSYELDKAFRENHVRGVRFELDKCEPIPRSTSKGRVADVHKCLDNFQRLTDFVKADADGVVIVIRWTYRVFPVPGKVDRLTFDNGEGAEEIDDYREYSALGEDDRLSQDAPAKAAAIRMLTDSFVATGKRIFLVYPIPELGWNIAKLNMRTHGELETISTPYQAYKSRQSFILDVLDGLPDAPNLTRVRTDQIFCNRARCLGQKNKVPLYYDDDHLSGAGADMIVGAIIPGIVGMPKSF